jgi:hypothetical protein
MSSVSIPSSAPSIRGAIQSIDASGRLNVTADLSNTVGVNRAIVRVTSDTQVADATGYHVGPEELQVGSRIAAWFKGPILETFPPQATAGVIVMSVVVPRAAPSIRGTITAIDANGRLRVEADAGTVIGFREAVVALTPESKVTDASGQTISDDTLTVGTRVSVFFTGPVLETFPVQATAGAIVMDADVPAPAPSMTGIITSITPTGALRVQEDTNSPGGFGEALIRLTPQTQVTDASGQPLSRDALVVSARVSVFFAGPILESLPPQATAGTIKVET